MLWDFEVLFLCALWALHSNVQSRESAGGIPGGHHLWKSTEALARMCHSWQLFPTHSAVSRDEDCKPLDNLLQCFVTLTVAQPFLLCNLDLTCCSLNNIIVLLIPGRGREQLFPFPYENLFAWGCDISPSSLSTNQLQFFWETFQPVQINIILQWMWLHTIGEKSLYFFLALTLIVKAISWAWAWNMVLLSSCMGHYFWNHPWWLYPLLPFKTCISQNCKGRDFCCSWYFYIFVLPCDSEILQLLSFYFMLTLLLLEFGT